jgi:hypothetical protein
LQPALDPVPGEERTLQVQPKGQPAPGDPTLRDATWQFGDGSSQRGITVKHSWAAGHWAIIVLATFSNGKTATASISLTVVAAPPPPPDGSLTVSITGDGEVDVAGQDSCLDGQDPCTYRFPANTRVTLTARAGPSAGNRLVGWDRDCSGSGPACTVTIPAGGSAIATVTFRQFATLTVQVADAKGRSTVTVPGLGICRSTCAASYPLNQSVTLTARAGGAGVQFVGWGGACSGVGGCTVTMDQAKTVTASFACTNLKPICLGTGAAAAPTNNVAGGSPVPPASGLPPVRLRSRRHALRRRTVKR